MSREVLNLLGEVNTLPTRNDHHSNAGSPVVARPSATMKEFDGEMFVGIRNVSAMPPFLMSLVSNGDCWAFIGSNTPFTAGRGDADHAMFPYRTADKILSQPGASGARTLMLVEQAAASVLWEPWQPSPRLAAVERNLFKSTLGTSVIFEEIHHTLGLRFAWRLTTSEKYGLVRFCTLENVSAEKIRLRCLDGWTQLIPPGVTQDLYEKYSYLAAAYMRHEQHHGLGIFTLNSGITDRAEPCESLRAAVAWSLGQGRTTVLLSGRQLESFQRGQNLKNELEVRGEFGAFFADESMMLAAGEKREWIMVADTGLDHCALVALQKQLAAPAELREKLSADVRATRDALRQRIAAADGCQQTADTIASSHHFANVLFNCMRGGTLPENYNFPSRDFVLFLQARNRELAQTHAEWLQALPVKLTLDQLRERAAATGISQLIRIAREYLPLTFSRRHGDPSRPWNRFAIRTQDEHGQTIYDYQGNWRDIFQNWESLAQSYPVALESMVAIFLNASTADGYNPYRITRSGIDWEVEDPKDPWSHIGYWGDHQIIYLLRLLESLEAFQPGRLARSLNECVYSCADVPYAIKRFDELTRNPRDAIHFDQAKHERLIQLAAQLGNDGKLFRATDGSVRLFTLGEKLLIPLLVKLSNLVPGGGVWLNTQRPEWNDANNALAGWGLSVVTVGHLRRYLNFLTGIFSDTTSGVSVSEAAARLIRQIADALPKTDTLDSRACYQILAALGRAGEAHRESVYAGTMGESIEVPVAEIQKILADALRVVDATLRANRRADGLYHSYNLLQLSADTAAVQNLDLMLEGQVSILGSGLLESKESLSLLQALRHSNLFRADQHSYLLYPEKLVASFMTRNRLPDDWRMRCPAIAALVAAGDRQLIRLDVNDEAHFHADFRNTSDLEKCLRQLSQQAAWKTAVATESAALIQLWEGVFKHSAFTGRSGSMFAFEGIGSIYWHMIAKLLLAVEECHRQASEQIPADAKLIAQLRAAYYDIRRGLGFTKTPEVYGAFPTDPYSHTPRHLGAQQPGMTGQVKEEILTRRAELGLQIKQGAISFQVGLLNRAEFFEQATEFHFADVSGRTRVLPLESHSLVYLFCQVPVTLNLGNEFRIRVKRADGSVQEFSGHQIPADVSREIFGRTGTVDRIAVTVPAASLRD